MEVYYSLPSEFNDPFEAKPNIEYPSKTALKKYLISKGAQHRELKTLVKINFDLYKNSIGKIKAMFEMGEKNAFRYFCLTPHYDNLLMWSHYADSHRGICIGFDIDHEHDFDSINSVFGSASCITYTKLYPKISMLELMRWMDMSQFVIPEEYDFVEGILKRLTYTKGSAWEYENEIRYSQPSSKGIKLFEFPKHKLREVIIGANTAPDVKEKIIGCAKSNFSHAIIKQVITSTTEFKLEFTLIE